MTTSLFGRGSGCRRQTTSALCLRFQPAIILVLTALIASRGRGIAALEEIKAGAKVLAVPESLWITTASPEGPLAQLFAEQVDSS